MAPAGQQGTRSGYMWMGYREPWYKAWGCRKRAVEYCCSLVCLFASFFFTARRKAVINTAGC